MGAEIKTLHEYLADKVIDPESQKLNLGQIVWFANFIVEKLLPVAQSMDAVEMRQRKQAQEVVEKWCNAYDELISKQTRLDDKIEQKCEKMDGAGKGLLVLFLKIAVWFLKLRKQAVSKRVLRSQSQYLKTDGFLARKRSSPTISQRPLTV